MTPKDILVGAVDPAIALLHQLTGIVPTQKARVLTMAIAGQESRWAHRLQVPVAYARGFWQFERGGGVAGVLSHPGSRGKIAAVCADLLISCDVATVYEAIAWNDTLAASMARLLLFTDPRPLPEIGDVDGGWSYYLANWRPGAPHPETWPARHATARELVNSNPWPGGTIA